MLKLKMKGLLEQTLIQLPKLQSVQLQLLQVYMLLGE